VVRSGQLVFFYLKRGVATTGFALSASGGQTPVRFCRDKFFPKSQQEAMGRFLALFHKYGWIYKPLGGGGWISANEKWALTDSEILKAVACVHPKHFLGARAGKATRFGVLDIDAGSKYHNVKQLGRILEALAKAGISETSIYRSSDSGGWHIYLFFDEPISSRDLRAQLVQLLRLSGFDIAKGTLEVFPAPGDGRGGNSSIGNGLRLPLQPGFAWLNQDGLVIEERDSISPVEALDRFIRDMECGNSRHDFHQMKAYVSRLIESQEQITSQVSQISQISKAKGVVVPFRKPDGIELSEYTLCTVLEVFQGLPPGINAETWIKGREFAQVGLTGKSQRAEAIYCLSHYLFYGDPERRLPALGYGYETERQWAIEKILSSLHNGCSKDINKGRGDAVAQIERAASWLPKDRRGKENNVVPFVKKVPIAWQRNSANLKSEATKKIQAAVADFEEADMTFSVRDLQLKTGCSNKTLYKHRGLWKSAQERLQTGGLAAVTPEYNAVVGAASSESLLPSAVAKKIAPPGLLAARRVAYEISMRRQREEREKKTQRRDGFIQLDNLWRLEIEKIVPAALGSCETKKLRALLAVYLSAISRSPDDESESWIRGLITEVRSELERRPKQLELVFSEVKVVDLVESDLVHLVNEGG
jgi:hypothetical protein